MYDIIIIGGGPAGMTAGIYALRYKLSSMIITKVPGGTATEAHLVENYPGFSSLSGMELMMKFKEHFEALGGTIVNDEAKRIVKKEDRFVIDGERTYEARSVIIAVGSKRRKLNVKGEEEFLGKGVSYCATCDGYFFREKTVCVIGGIDSAASSAVHLSQMAKKVYLIYNELQVEPYWQDMLEKENIELVKDTVHEIKGAETVKSVVLSERELEVEGVFIETGSIPPKELASALGVNTKKGYIVVDEGQKTNVSGIFAAGDITTGSDELRQIITSASEGAIAARSAFRYCKNNSPQKTF
ncbi:MAG: NAD(P)/FAD-dependent oxidoreductase [Candidatus Woesearchaeota archaeon]